MKPRPDEAMLGRIENAALPILSGIGVGDG
jgi:hypothetical protein